MEKAVKFKKMTKKFAKFAKSDRKKSWNWKNNWKKLLKYR